MSNQSETGSEEYDIYNEEWSNVFGYRNMRVYKEAGWKKAEEVEKFNGVAYSKKIGLDVAEWSMDESVVNEFQVGEYMDCVYVKGELEDGLVKIMIFPKEVIDGMM
jgi:hypothetical protein